jgi:hypothetical protein
MYDFYVIITRHYQIYQIFCQALGVKLVIGDSLKRKKAVFTAKRHYRATHYAYIYCACSFQTQ